MNREILRGDDFVSNRLRELVSREFLAVVIGVATNWKVSNRLRELVSRESSQIKASKLLFERFKPLTRISLPGMCHGECWQWRWYRFKPLTRISLPGIELGSDHRSHTSEVSNRLRELVSRECYSVRCASCLNQWFQTAYAN